MSATPASEAAPGRALTVGLVLGVTVMAIGALAVVTVAPRIPAELGGLAHYGWLFSAHLLASLIGTVWGGAQADRHGPGRAFVLGLVAFVLGSALAAVAPSMVVVIGARALQGLGGGAVVTCIYVAVTVAYPDHARARVMALLSAAWVLPALLGPAAAGLVAELASWRWVFAALVPLASLVALLTVPSFVGLRPSTVVAPVGGRRLWHALVLAAAVGAGVWALGATAPWWIRALLGASAAVLVPRMLARLAPPRTLRLAPGLASVVAARGLLFAGFITVEVYLALMLTDLLGLSSAVTGLVIATGALVWALGSWLQARLEDLATSPSIALRWLALARRRERRVLLGVQVLGLGLALQLLTLVVPGSAALPLALVGWALAGVGIGFAHASSSVLAFERAEHEAVEPGSVSAALQLSDGVAAATATGVAGALLALVTPGAGLAAGVAAAYAVGVAAAMLSLLAASRIDVARTRSTPTPA